MLYESTRGRCGRVSSSMAIKLGIAPDRGLFVPCENVKIYGGLLEQMIGLDYRGRAVLILKKYLSDFTAEEIKECVRLSYNTEKFGSTMVAPLHKLDQNLYVLELWHGPTCAFKDVALQILPHLLTSAALKTGEKSTIVILVATSGDTGKAALEGFKNVPGAKIIVFYPEQGVSEIQKLQMVTQEGNNVAVVAVQGNFDDAQTGVKNVFADAELNRELKQHNFTLSSANSINWGRLVPQIVYYFSAYLDLAEKGEIIPGEKINFVVPTGNFGNILAAYYAMDMGLPVNRLICAANLNNVLTEFIRTGVYNKDRLLQKTISPSMDILISSNLERLLYLITGRNHDKVRRWMASLNGTGAFYVDDLTRTRISRIFWSDFASDAETMKTIGSIYRSRGYMLDPHTAVGINIYGKYSAGTGDKTKTVVASTASPFKFNASVARAILGENAVTGKDEFSLLEILSAAGGMEIPAGLRDLDKKTVLHNRTVPKNKIAEAVRNIILS